MSRLKLENWRKLSEKEKGIRYKDLSDHDRYLVRIGGSPNMVDLDSVDEDALTEEQKKEVEWIKKWSTKEYD